jgi:hypothetical protein
MKVNNKYLLLGLLAGLTNAAQANHHEEYAYSDYDRSCNQYCGAWDLQVQGGLNLIKWRHRSDVLNVFCSGAAASIATNEIQQFSSAYKKPWIIGGQVGYRWDDSVRAYVEVNYSQAKAKTVVFPTLGLGESYIGFSTQSKYALVDAYVGLRFYAGNFWCDRAAFFLGGKVGLTHHKSIDGTLAAQSFGGLVTTIAVDADLTSSNTVVSGGLDFGFDVNLCGNWSLVVAAGVIASCGPRFNGNLVVPANEVVPTSNLIYGGVGTELRFPITAGLRYSF